jgi:hypothetical protein
MAKRMRSRQARPGIEGLESRELKTVSAVSNLGNLVIRATSQASLSVVQTASRQWAVYDSGTLVDQVSGITGGIFVNLSAQDDQIDIDLSGLDVVGGVQINGAGGNDTIRIGHGLVRGPLQIQSGGGEDQVSLGNFGGALEVQGLTQIDGGAGSANSLAVGGNVGLRTNVLLRNVNVVSFEPDSSINGALSVTVQNSGAMSLAVAGTVDRHLQADGTALNDNVSIGSSAVVGSLETRLGVANDAVVLAGQIGQATISTGAGDDALVAAGTITNRLAAAMSGGSDSVALQANVGDPATPNAPALRIQTGMGMDTVAALADHDVMGQGLIDLGPSGDQFVIYPRANTLGTRVNGSGGINTFYGPKERLLFAPVLFQVFYP